MNCKYCELQVGNQYNLVDCNITCYHCGNTFYVNYISTLYKYKNTNEHYFQTLEECFCSQCKTNLKEIIIPCGGSYYFNQKEFSKSLLISKE